MPNNDAQMWEQFMASPAWGEVIEQLSKIKEDCVKRLLDTESKNDDNAVKYSTFDLLRFRINHIDKLITLPMAMFQLAVKQVERQQDTTLKGMEEQLEKRMKNIG